SLSPRSARIHEEKHPGIDRVSLGYNGGRLEVEMVLFPSNIGFHGMDNLDTERFERSIEGSSRVPILKVTLNGPVDPIIEQQLVDFLSTQIKTVSISLTLHSAYISISDLSMCAKLFCEATIGNLIFHSMILDDTTA
ncbi:hypothetical protein PMAYCL1PPCAC_27161, partial [Pristionchus mayeri]